MKNGIITVRDRHFGGGSDEDEFGELSTSCTVGVEGDSIVVRYYEKFDEMFSCSTCLMIKQGRVTMMRSGKYSTSMIFEQQKRHICCYETPFGEIMIGVYTNAIFTDFNENGGVIHLAFTIDSNGDLVSENEIKITVEVKEDQICQ